MVYYCSTTYWYSMIHVGIVRICSEFSMVDESFRKRQDRTCAFRSDPKRAVSENSPHTAFQSDQNTLDSRFPFIIVVTIKLFAMMYCIYIYYIYIGWSIFISLGNVLVMASIPFWAQKVLLISVDRGIIEVKPVKQRFVWIVALATLPKPKQFHWSLQ